MIQTNESNRKASYILTFFFNTLFGFRLTRMILIELTLTLIYVQCLQSCTYGIIDIGGGNTNISLDLPLTKSRRVKSAHIASHHITYARLSPFEAEPGWLFRVLCVVNSLAFLLSVP